MRASNDSGTEIRVGAGHPYQHYYLQLSGTTKGQDVSDSRSLR